MAYKKLRLQLEKKVDIDDVMMAILYRQHYLKDYVKVTSQKLVLISLRKMILLAGYKEIHHLVRKEVNEFYDDAVKNAEKLFPKLVVRNHKFEIKGDD